MPTKNSHPKAIAKKQKVRKLQLRLYVAGQTPRSIAALANLKQVCEERVPGKYKIEVTMMNEDGQQKDQKSATFTVS